MSILKFHGNFRDLIPNGWEFQKLFANNYRQYHKEVRPGVYMRVWQHHGGYVEFDDTFHHTEEVIKAALDDSIPWEDHKLNYPSGPHEWTDKPIAILYHTGEVVAWNNNIHDPLWARIVMQKDGATEEEIQKEADRRCEHYRKLIITHDMVNFFNEMIEKGWIKI